MANHAGKITPLIESPYVSYRPTWIDNVVVNREFDGWDTSISVSTTSTSTQPIIAEAQNHHAAFKALSFSDDFYNRIIIEPGVIDVGNLVSEQFYEVNVFNGYFETKELENITVQDADGMLITGPVAPAVWGPLETRQYQITISTDGPPSINAQLSFNFVGTSDDIIIAITGARIVMLPYQAEVPWSESLEWKTNVLTANNGNEQRVRLRKKARQSIKGNYPVPNSHLARAFNMAYGWAQRAWAVAMWSEIQHIGVVDSGITVIYCDTTKYDFRSDSLVCLWQSNDENEVIEVETVFADRISLKRVLSKSYVNAFIMPVRIGVVKGGIQRNTNGYKSELSIEYEFKDNVDLNPAIPSQFLTYDIYFDTTLSPSDLLDEKITSRIDVVDYDTGIVDYFPPWLYNRTVKNVQFLNENPEQSWLFKQWLHRRAGRLRPYWLPTFEHNLRLKMEGNVSSSLICHSDDYRTLGDAHNHVAIQYTDNSWRARTIVGHSMDDSTTIQVGIDSPLNVDASLIKQISFLSLHRLNTDRVDIEWIGNGVNLSTVPIIEIKP